MNQLSGPALALSRVVLYEGYLLYPYQRSALKNREPHPLGALYPPRWCAATRAGDSDFAVLECVAIAGPDSELTLRARFLQFVGADPLARECMAGPFRLETLERQEQETIVDCPPVRGVLTARARRATDTVVVITASVANRGGLPEALDRRSEVLPHALVAAHLVLSLTGGMFASSIDPPPGLEQTVRACGSRGVWPVLAGPEGTADVLFASALALPDHPQIAPESPGDFFDATEMDEMLVLRILTLSDEEQRELAAGDARAAELLQRSRSLPAARLRALHGAWREPGEWRVGQPVRLRPRPRGDAWDLFLVGRTATVQAVERDLEGRLHVAVTVDEDPGADLGEHGHRFFFSPAELERLS